MSDGADGKDDDYSRHYIRFVLAAASHNNSSRRLASTHLEVSFIPLQCYTPFTRSSKHRANIKRA